jgi:hypothetical protein
MSQSQMLKTMFGQKEFKIKGQVFTINQTLIANYNETDDKFLCVFDAINAQGIHISIGDVTHIGYGQIGNNRLPNEFDVIEDYIESQPYLA